MRIWSTFLGMTLCAISTSVLAQSIVDAIEQDVTPTVIEKKGCGFSRPLVVAGMIGNPPFGWVERHDELATKDLESYGLGREILDKLQKKLGFSYVSTGFLSYNKALTALRKGDVDLLLASYYRPQDLGTGIEILTPGYFRNVFTVYFKKGNEIPMTSLTDLEGWNGLIRREENIYPLIYQRLPKGIHLTQVSTSKKAFEMLMNGEADYLITSPYAAEAELRRYKLNQDIISSDQALFPSTLFFAFSSNSGCDNLKEKFSESLREEEFSAPYVGEITRKLIDNWGERFRDKPGLIEEEEKEEAQP